MFTSVLDHLFKRKKDKLQYLFGAWRDFCLVQKQNGIICIYLFICFFVYLFQQVPVAAFVTLNPAFIFEY